MQVSKHAHRHMYSSISEAFALEGKINIFFDKKLANDLCGTLLICFLQSYLGRVSSVAIVNNLLLMAEAWRLHAAQCADIAGNNGDVSPPFLISDMMAFVL